MNLLRMYISNRLGERSTKVASLIAVAVGIAIGDYSALIAQIPLDKLAEYIALGLTTILIGVPDKKVSGPNPIQ